MIIVPLLGKERNQALLYAFDLATRNAVSVVDHKGEVFMELMDGGQVPVLFLFFSFYRFLLCGHNFGVVLVLIGT